MTTHAQRSSAVAPPQGDPLPYDRDRLLARLGGSSDILAEVAALFCSDAERMHGELTVHVSREDERAVSLAHQLKGVLLNVAADRAAASARELEILLRAHQWAAAAPLAERLGSELRELVSAFSREANGS